MAAVKTARGKELNLGHRKPYRAHCQARELLVVTTLAVRMYHASILAGWLAPGNLYIKHCKRLPCQGSSNSYRRIKTSAQLIHTARQNPAKTRGLDPLHLRSASRFC